MGVCAASLLGLMDFVLFLESMMGRGDKRTRKGKIFSRSHGKTRPHGKGAVKKAAAKR